VPLVVCGLLLVGVIAVFGQGARHQFVNYDDDIYVFANPYVLRGVSGEGFVWAFAQCDAAAQWIPMTWLSLMVDAQLVGPNGGRHDLIELAGMMHLTNVAMHAVNSMLLFLMLWRMTAGLWQSAFVASVFAVHPLHVESVAWVTERKDVLSAFFGFLAIGAYAWYARSPGPVRYLSVAAAFALGLMAKPILVTWPLVLLLLDYWPLRRQFTSRLLLEKAPLFLLAAASAAITFLAHRSRGAVATLESAPLAERLARAATQYVGYLGKTVWTENLAAMYNAPPMSSYWPPLAAGLLLAVVTAITLLGARSGRRWLAVGWLFFLLVLLPMIGLVQAGAQVMPDRSMYLPQIGITIALAWGVTNLAGRWRYRHVAIACASVLVLTALMASAWRQVSYWRNSESLWAHALDCTPDNAVAHNHLGLALAGRGCLDGAIEHYRKAVELQPDYAVAYFNLGVALADRGQFDKAIEAYEEGLKLKPQDVEARYRLSIALTRSGNSDRAIGQLKEALDLQPGQIAARLHLADIYLTAGRFNEAIDQYKRALEFDSNNAAAIFNLGIALERSGKEDEAMQRFRTALRLASSSNQKGLADAIRERIRQRR
jgi:Flp pilus assembly protein TadD